MKKSESLAGALIDGMKQAAFDKYREEELAKRKAHTKDQLLNAACTFAAYIRMLNTGLASDIDLLCQARLNGIKAQKTKQAKSGAQGRGEKYQPLKDQAFKLVKARKWRSRRNAAQTIAPEILELAKSLNVPLSEAQAEITITNWLKAAGLPASI